MINNLKSNLAESIALKKFTKTQSFGNSFRQFISNAKDIMVILPENLEDMKAAFKVIKHFNTEKKNIYLYFNIDVANYIPVELKYISVTFNPADKTKIGLPTKDHLSKIEIIFFDLVVDLNRENNIFYSVISSAPKSKYRVGFTKKNSDKFYNFQVPNEINSEKSYRNLLNSIRMF